MPKRSGARWPRERADSSRRACVTSRLTHSAAERSACADTHIVRAVADGYRVLFTIGRAHDGPNLVRVFRIRPRSTAYVGYERTKT